MGVYKTMSREIVIQCDRCHASVDVKECNTATLVLGKASPVNPIQNMGYIPASKPHYKTKCSMDLCPTCLEATGWVEWLEDPEPKKTIGEMFEDIVYQAVEEAQEG
jgi:hypothetical protein